VSCKPDSVSAEGIALDDLRSGLDIIAVNSANDVGMGQIEVIEALVHLAGARVQFCAYSAITDYRTVLKEIQKAYHSSSQ
jgi:hypothetical protein